MGKIKEVLIRSGMMFLALSPLCVLISYFMHTNYLIYPASMLLMILIIGFVSLCPPYVGNYKVEENVVSVSRKTSDPNPDKEFEHVVSKSGHRVPLRAPILFTLIPVMTAVYLFLPDNPLRGGSWANMVVPAAVLFGISIFAATDFVHNESLFTQVQGVLTGTVVHVICAIMLHFIKRTDVTPTYYAGVLSSVFLIVSVLMLNGNSLLMSINSDKQKTPEKVRKKNRLITVLAIIFIFLFSCIDILRKGAEWLFNVIAGAVGKAIVFLTDLFLAAGGGGGEGGGGGDGDLLGELAEDIESKPTPQIVKYLMYAIAIAACLALLFLLIREIVKLLKRVFLSMNTTEGVTGYIDETEEIRPDDRESANPARRILDALFNRDKPWGQLDGRGRVRRVMKLIYRRSGKDLSCLTAQEARPQVDIRQADGDELFSLYDEARYSTHEISSDKADAIKKAAKV